MPVAVRHGGAERELAGAGQRRRSNGRIEAWTSLRERGGHGGFTQWVACKDWSPKRGLHRGSEGSDGRRRCEGVTCIEAHRSGALRWRSGLLILPISSTRARGGPVMATWSSLSSTNGGGGAAACRSGRRWGGATGCVASSCSVVVRPLPRNNRKISHLHRAVASAPMSPPGHLRWSPHPGRQIQGLWRIDEGWAAARFDSLPHVVHILTSKDREGEIQFLKEQSDLIEDVVDEVVHAYHHGFNKAIQNYSQILRLFSESAESITGLKGEMADAKKLLGRKNKHLGQLWYRSLTLRHVLSLLDQVEDVAKVRAPCLAAEDNCLLSSFDGPDDESNFDMRESDGRSRKDSKSICREIPIFLSSATPDEFLESMIKADAPLNVKYLRTLVQCLSMLGKVAAAGAVICQRVRSTIHDVITSKIKSYDEEGSKSTIDKDAKRKSNVLHLDGSIRYQLHKQKAKNGASLLASQLVISPILPAMAPTGDSQCAVSQLLGSIFECLLDILGRYCFLGLSENHIIVGELLEQKASSEVDNINTPHTANGDASWNPDSESSQATGGFSVAFSLSVVQSECQQLLCEILRATPEAATTDAAVQTARLANKDPVKEKRQVKGGEEIQVCHKKDMEQQMSYLTKEFS
ncbi:hypothetical protein PR202_gb29348 [Eleusine coracana subsp. coracana]|uniref:Exocyst complex component Sec8 n=1 Tax=Eleusine coracana subsp. coracana TaxID=191504 RepID=A0AAV5FWU5_ELECO|nr:hypothetical protein PR202_gb29348 [Eleusine coracana subsp. coracana]